MEGGEGAYLGRSEPVLSPRTCAPVAGQHKQPPVQTEQRRYERDSRQAAGAGVRLELHNHLMIA